MDSNIYYHFFDRELRESVNASFTDKEIIKIICVSIFMTNNIYYLPISNLYESYPEYPESIEYIKNLDRIGLIYPASSHKSKENFLVSRQYLYKHDKDRYPMYFCVENAIWSPNMIVLNGSTTEILKNKFLTTKTDIPELSKKSNDNVAKLIYNTISKSCNKAVTFSLFKDSIGKVKLTNAEMQLTQKCIRKHISIYYTSRYLESEAGTIITGIPQLLEYDILAINLYETNYSIYSMILNKVGIDINSTKGLEIVLKIRQKLITFESIYIILKNFVRAVGQLVYRQGSGHKKRLMQYLYSEIKFESVSNDIDLYRNLNNYIDDLCNRSVELKMEMVKINEDKKSLVIVAVTDVEMKELFVAIEKHCPQLFLKEKICKDLVYRELIGCKMPVYVVQSQMGSIGTGSIINTMHKICQILNPETVIMGGIAFGSDQGKQKLGDILVSQQVWNYEPSKVKDDDIISRGDKSSASSFLLQLFHSSALEYKDVKVHFGLIASGEKLVNSEEFMYQLKAREEEIVGGDMEAAGLVSVCLDKRIEWIVAKAICDWGFKKEDNAQQIAAHNAFDFIMHNLKKIILI